MKILSLFVLTVMLILLIAGCNSGKEVSKSTRTVDSTAITELRKQLLTVTAERDNFQKRVEELEYLEMTFVPCPPALDVDSLRAVLIAANCSPKVVDSLMGTLNQANTIIKKLADGTLIIEGKVAKLSQSKQRLEQVLAEKDKRILALSDSLSKAEAKVVIREVEREKVVKRFPWWWVVLAFAAGAAAGIAVVKWAFLETLK